MAEWFPLATASDEVVCEQLQGFPMLWRDPAPALRRKLIVSDVHLGPGTGDARFENLEDFAFDATWSRFLADQARRGPTDLIVAGDFLELWQIEGGLGHPPGSDPKGALAALEVVIAAHPRALRAVADFLAAGDHRLILIPGNHDADLIWPTVQLRLARELGVRRREQLVFVNAWSYRHGGVHIEHGHRYDGANAMEHPGAPVALDEHGVCRLRPVWGEVFVAEFFNDLERRYPFVDNLSPSGSAVVWGLGDEPDTAAVVHTAARFADLLAAQKNRALNKTALRAAILNAAGSPFRAGTDNSVRSALWDALPSTEGAATMVVRLLTEDRYEPLRAGFVRIGEAMPSMSSALLAVAALDFGLLGQLVGEVIRDPMAVAAAEVADAQVIVFAHTHEPGGQITPLDDGRTYVNTGAWVPSQSVDALKQRGLDWTQLRADDRDQFPARFPAVEIRYQGKRPGVPRLLYAK